MCIAYESLSRGLQTAAHRMVVVPREEYERGGASKAMVSVVTAVPGVILRPMIGATEAISKAVLGNYFLPIYLSLLN
jgi:autophagy-related protein 2